MAIRDSHPSELDFQFTRSPVLAVELDVDSLWNAGFNSGWATLLNYGLARYASEHKDKKVTIYSYACVSVNLGYFHNAEFFSATKNESVLKVIEASLNRKGVEAWISSDTISCAESSRIRHIQDGYIWGLKEIDDEEIWYTDSTWKEDMMSARKLKNVLSE